MSQEPKEPASWEDLCDAFCMFEEANGKSPNVIYCTPAVYAMIVKYFKDENVTLGDRVLGAAIVKTDAEVFKLE